MNKFTTVAFCSILLLLINNISLSLAKENKICTIHEIKCKNTSNNIICIPEINPNTNTRNTCPVFCNKETHIHCNSKNGQFCMLKYNTNSNNNELNQCPVECNTNQIQCHNPNTKKDFCIPNKNKDTNKDNYCPAFCDNKTETECTDEFNFFNYCIPNKDKDGFKSHCKIYCKENEKLCMGKYGHADICLLKDNSNSNSNNVCPLYCHPTKQMKCDNKCIDLDIVNNPKSLCPCKENYLTCYNANQQIDSCLIKNNNNTENKCPVLCNKETHNKCYDVNNKTEYCASNIDVKTGNKTNQCPALCTENELECKDENNKVICVEKEKYFTCPVYCDSNNKNISKCSMQNDKGLIMFEYCSNNNNNTNNGFIQKINNKWFNYAAENNNNSNATVKVYNSCPAQCNSNDVPCPVLDSSFNVINSECKQQNSCNTYDKLQ